MADRTTIIHLVAGGVGGTTGAVLTCPLEVVKTRLQSSVASFRHPVILSPAGYAPPQQHIANLCTCSINSSPSYSTVSHAQPRMSILQCLRYIVQEEGAIALFKGLGPNLIGVAPSRAIYFCAYAKAKKFCNTHFTPETPLVHVCSAAFAGFSACTVTNPIWYVKTMLQLDQKKRGAGRLTVRQCIFDTNQKFGLRGFYKGITASYAGISETVIHFVIYEAIKRKLMERKGVCHCDERTPKDFVQFMFAGAVSKTVASSIAYPHEVVRTRLREPGDKFKGFFQTLSVVFKEEGAAGLYRGLATQLVRQIPNTAIMMSTYEFVVYLLSQDYG